MRTDDADKVGSSSFSEHKQYCEQLGELGRAYSKVQDPNIRAALLYLMAMVPHVDTESALALIEEYFPNTDIM